MYERILKHPENKSFFLFGPRGIGKSTWVKKTFPLGLYLDLLDSALYNDLLAKPNRLEEFIPTSFNDWIIIDEIQKIHLLLDEVHRLIEDKKYRFILAGSSARKLRKKGVNLLGGRARTLSFYPLTVRELGIHFNFTHSLMYGFLPSVYTDSDPGAYLESYLKTYIKEEVIDEGFTRNLPAFARFLEAASFSQGSLLNISEVSRECAVERKVVEGYFSIVEDILLATRVPVFTKRAVRRLVSHPKFYFFDVGVYRTIRPKGPLDRPEEIEGIALETLYFQEMRALNVYYNLGYEIYYWRTTEGQEVDFVLYGERGIKAFEIKRAGTIHPQDARGMRAFLEQYPMAKAYIFYGGKYRKYFDGIEIIPHEEALNSLYDLVHA